MGPKFHTRWDAAFLRRWRRRGFLALIGLCSMPIWVVLSSAVVMAAGMLAGGVILYLIPPLALLGMGAVGALAGRIGVGRVLGAVLLLDALVAALFWPEMRQKHVQADACGQNLKVLSQALVDYARAHGNQFPARLGEVTPTYLQALPTCPAAGADSYSASYAAGTTMFTLFCSGNHHAPEGLPSDWPRATF